MTACTSFLTFFQEQTLAVAGKNAFPSRSLAANRRFASDREISLANRRFVSDLWRVFRASCIIIIKFTQTADG